MSLCFFNDPATTQIYTLSLHDALPICHRGRRGRRLLDSSGAEKLLLIAFCLRGPLCALCVLCGYSEIGGIEDRDDEEDRKSTRLNSSHMSISYAVFCLKKKNTN